MCKTLKRLSVFRTSPILSLSLSLFESFSMPYNNGFRAQEAVSSNTVLIFSLHSLQRTLFLEMILAAFCLIILLCNCSALVGSLNDEGLALLSFKQSIEQLPGGSLYNWNPSDESPCSWHGVTCEDQRVVSLSIPKKRLVGILPPALGNLSALRRINLRNNKFYGSLPVELFGVEGLQSLILSGNSLSGPVFPEIGKLRHLQTLDLSQNLFNGSIPSSLIQCRQLKSLVLSQNNFNGSLPDAFGTSLIFLQNLNVSINRLSGLIPGDMGKLSGLQETLDLSHNLFTGPIPATLGNLPEKVYIDLSYNNLSGPIPQNAGLTDRGPTAFVGNPLLCGPPLKGLCSSPTRDPKSQSSLPVLPKNDSSQDSGGSPGTSGGGHVSSTVVVIAVVVGTVVGICLVGCLISYSYQRFGASKTGGIASGCNSEEGKECFCFRKDGSETLSESAERHDLVPLDLQVNFDFDELLKASAFVLGKSRIGILYKVVIENGPILAVRRLGEGDPRKFKEFQAEVEAVGKIRHPNIVALRAYCWSVDEKLLIYDYIPNGDLATAIHGKAGIVSFTPLSWPIRLRIMRGTANGLAYLHEFSPKKYVHGDLKPSNILLGQNMEPQISDFGLGHLASIAGESPFSQENGMTPMTPTPPTTPVQSSPNEFTALNSIITVGANYQAPEALRSMKPSQKWDVYSYGVIVLEMITGKPLPITHFSSSGIDLVRWIQLCIKEKKPLTDMLDPFLAHELDMEEEMISVIKLALACAHESPERRPSMRSVCDSLDRLDTSTD